MNEFDKNIKAAQKKNLALYFTFASIALAAIFAYLAWLILAEGYAIKVYPVEAQPGKTIVVNEGVGITFNDSVYNLSSTLTFTVDADKFEPKTVQVTDSTPSTIEVVLEPSPGTILGRTSPAFSETLWSIDGEPVHIGEQLEHKLSPGDYTLLVENKFHQPISQSVQVNSEQVIDINLTFSPVDGMMTIASSPEGADILINQEPVGKTPLTLQSKGGRYDIQLVKEGYETLNDTIDITSSDTKAERNYQLEPKKGQLLISASPDDGVLLIDGKQRKLGDNLVYANQIRRILYQRDGYYGYSTSLRLKPGETKRLEIELKPEQGKVILSSQPAANIYIDGVSKGKGTVTVTLPAVPHSIEFRKTGYRTISKQVIPSAKRTNKLSVNMLSEFEARRKEDAPLFVDTIGIKMNRYQPTAFTMGSAPNEKGRRRNEVQIPVNFKRPILVSQHEITEAQYKRFDKSRPSSKLPVTDVSWNDAALYCNWLSTQEGLPPFYIVKSNRVVGSQSRSNGYRLPTEAEWEWLSKKSRRAKATVFVWGNSERIREGSGNFGDSSLSGKQVFVLKDYNDGFVGKAPVGSFKPDRAGLYDLAGNVSEWVHDFHSYVPPKASAAVVDYLGPAKGSNHIWKGGNYQSGQLASLRASYKEMTDSASPTVGFRIARYD